MKSTKILALLLVVVMSLSFVSCGGLFGGEESDTETQTVTDSESKETETEKVTDEENEEDEDFGDLGGDTEGEKLPDGQVIYFEDFQKQFQVK